MSEVGFVAIGYDSGYICVVDLRGPAVIFLEDLSNVLSEKDKKGKEKDKGWTCDLIPKSLIVARYFADEQEALHPCLSLASSRLRSSFRCTLPVVVIGSASMNSISRGYS